MFEDKLYKGKYIVVCYDSNGYILEVADRPSEITCFNKGTIMSMCSKILQGKEYKKVKLIDVTEKKRLF